MRLSVHRWLIRAAALVASFAACPGQSHAAEPAAVAWAPLGEARVVNWSPQGTVTLLRGISLESPVTLAPNELLLVPVDPGDVLRSLGNVAIGLASGSADMPDAITWWPVAQARDIRVPTWSSARFLAVRSAPGTSARVELLVARAVSDPFAWHRFDEAVKSWLFDGRPITLATPTPAARAVREIQALEQTLIGVDRSLRAPWLMARWLELSLRVRPLASPYFAHTSATPSGGTSSVASSGPNALPESRDLQAGEDLVLSSSGSDVLRLEIRAKTAARTRITVFEGETLARELEIAEHHGGPPFSQPQSVRAVVPASASRVRVHVLEGSASVGFESFAQRSGLLDAFSERDRRIRDAASERCAPEWLRRPSESNGRRAQPLMQALVDFETARCASTVEDALRSASALWGRRSSLPSSARAPLERALLQRLLDVGVSHTDTRFALSQGGDPEDRAASEALVAALARAPDRRASERAERTSAGYVERTDWVQLARRLWLRGTVWAALPPREPSNTRLNAELPEPEPDSAGLCPVQTGAALRWTVLDAHRPELVVGSSGGTHSHVLLRLEPGLERELSLKIGGVPITIHGAAGLLGHVALAPGAQRVEVEAGSVVLARAPREGAVPCLELRELERWSVLEPRAHFELGPENLNRPARLSVRAQSLAGRAQKLQIESGSERYEAWVRPPATGAIEIPRVGGTSLEVRAEVPLWVRASLRQLPSLAPAARVVAQRPSAAPQSEALLLERLRRATRRLGAASSEPERSTEHLERAELLISLGARRLSDLERLRGGGAAPSDETHDEPTNLALRFPEHTPAAVVIGVASQIPPLAAAGDPEPLRRARALDDAHAPPTEIVGALSDSAASSSAVDALLLANAAERARLPSVAAGAYERIGRATKSGAALARAATLSADVSATLSDRQVAFHGYLLARRATELGDAALDALGRLAPTVTWLSATAAGSDNGSLLLVHTGSAATESLGLRIRRALLDADAAAVLLTDDRRLELQSDRASPSELDFSLSCMALEQDGSCQTTLEVDGRKQRCLGAEAAASALKTQCHVNLPAGKHRVELAPAPGEGLVLAALVQSGQQIIQPRVVSNWTEVDPAHPLNVRVFGPTVLRITSRAPANQAQHLVLELNSSVGLERRTWDIPGGADATSSRFGQSSGAVPEFGPENEQFVLLEGAGEQHVRLIPDHGHTLFRLYAAFGSGVARERTLGSAATPSATPAQSAELPLPPAAAVSTDPEEGPLTLNATVSLERTDLSELEGGRADVHEQYRFTALRELWRSRVYGSVSLIYRSRFGVDSRGALVIGATSPHGFIPGSYERWFMMQQALPSGIATGWYGVVGLVWAVPLAPNATLVPWTDVIGRHAAAIKKVTPDVDSDVYTDYARLEPVSVNTGLRLDTRPFLDTLASYGLAGRYSPGRAAVDRADAVISIDALPGSGLFPWLSAWSIVSYRPLDSVRKAGFTRTTLGAQLNFFGWLRGSEHWTLFGRVIQFVDWPARAQTLSFALGLSADETFGRGMRDYPPRNVPFRGRMDEGSARVERRGPAQEPAWEVAP